MSIVLGVLVVPAAQALPSHCSLLTVSSILTRKPRAVLLTSGTDSKQARDLVNILTEAKQEIDPRLAEMARYGGGGGGRGYGGGRGGRGGGRGGGGGWSGGNSAPMGGGRRW